jgi:hypothetical protein
VLACALTPSYVLLLVIYAAELGILLVYWAAVVWVPVGSGEWVGRCCSAVWDHEGPTHKHAGAAVDSSGVCRRLSSCS